MSSHLRKKDARLTLDTVVKPRFTTITREKFAAGVILFCPADLADYSLNGAGAEIWGYLRQGCSLREISLKLQHKSGNDPDSVNQELLRFIDMLWDLRLVRVRSLRPKRHPSLSESTNAGNRIAALKFVSQALSPHSKPERLAELHDPIASGRLPWQLVRNVANHYRVSSPLFIGLRAGELIHRLPAELRDYLSKSYESVSNGNTRLRRQTIEVVEALNGSGIDPILLKGAAYQFSNTIEPLRKRETADIDLLVPRDALVEAAGILRALGYRETAPPGFDSEEHHHWPPLTRRREEVPVEIHSDPVPKALSGMLPTEEIWAHRRPVENREFAAHVLCPTHRMLLNLLHSELAHERHVRGQISLRDLHELAWMDEILAKDLDWRTIRARMERHGEAKTLTAYLHLANRLFDMPLPPEISLNYGSALHWVRCQAIVKRPLFAKLTSSMNFFSAKKMRQRYVCGDSRWGLTTARARHLYYLVRRRMT